MDISTLKRDSAVVYAGQWIDDIPGFGNVRLKVCGLTSPAVVAARGRKERKVPRDQRQNDGTIIPDVALKIFGEVLHEVVLLDWDGLTDKGKPVPYDSKLAHLWLTDPDYSFFADAVVWAAQIVDKGKVDTKEELEGNSKVPFDGK